MSTPSTPIAAGGSPSAALGAPLPEPIGQYQGRTYSRVSGSSASNASTSSDNLEEVRRLDDPDDNSDLEHNQPAIPEGVQLSEDSQTERQSTPQAISSGSTKEESCSCSCGRTTRTWIGVAFAAVALFVGTVGLLAYTGHLNVALQGVGTLTNPIGLYTMLGGLSAFAITAILIVCTQRAACAEKVADAPLQPPAHPATQRETQVA